MVNAYLDLAEDRAKRKFPMTTEDWARRPDAVLECTERDILQDGGKVSAEDARAHTGDRVREIPHHRRPVVRKRLRQIEAKRKPGTDNG